MTIFFLNRYFYPDHSATSQHLSDLAFHLADQGLSVAIITSRQRYDDPVARLPTHETIRNVKVYRVWTTRFGRGRLLGRAIDYLTFYTSVAWRLFRMLSRLDIVVAATDPPLISVVGAIVARLRGATLVNWCHDLFPEVAAALEIKLAQGPLGAVLRRLRNASLRQAACNVVLGERMAERLVDEGVPPDRIKIIHNWADGEEIRPRPSTENNLREAWGLMDKFVVGYSGNLGRAHEFETILDAATALGDHPGIVFLFIGAGAKLDWVEREVERRGLENVVFKPYQPRDMLPKALTLIDLHVISLMPRLEGLIVPSKFYGIAAAGRPAFFIGDKDGEIPRLLRAKDGGLAVGVGDVKETATAIRELASDPARCDRLGRNARRAFEENFSMSIALDAWHRLLMVWMAGGIQGANRRTVLPPTKP